jgi:hypothetical protein
MKANELRIGNLLLDNFNKEVEVKDIMALGINSQWGYSMFSYEDLKPIPLTEEWLKKFGLQSNQWFCENSFCIVEDKTGDTHYGWCMKVQNASHTKKIEFGYFKYVHQLQNIYFALTGEELTFKSE